MKQRIKQLSPEVANQVAAGEVIERPAAALKELIENSLDADATSIEIIIVGGGADMLEVQDDGIGIVVDDLPRTLFRHATSKIETVEDFLSINTYGFRGEALASLAAVSDFSIASRAADDDHGYIFSPAIVSPRPQPMAVGTIVTARGLFANLPARRRFLRTASTEGAHCANTAIIAALAAYTTAFKVTSNGRERLNLPVATDGGERLEKLFPRLQGYTLPVHDAASALTLNGHVFSPTLGATGKSIGQFLYVNGRFVRDRLLRRAVSDALRSMSHDGEPGYALFLTLPTEAVDVNTHPAKLEVRFIEPRAVFEFVRRAVDKALAIPLGVPLSAPNNNSRATTITQSATPFSTASTLSTTRLPTTPQPQAGSNKEAVEAWRRMFNEAKIAAPALPTTALFGEEPLGRALGQLHNIYIIAENNNGLVVVDMHAAHERILYEDLKTAYDNGKLIMQPLLAPVCVPLSPVQAATLAEFAGVLVGITATPTDNDDGNVSAVASIIAGRADPATLLVEMLDAVSQDTAAGETRSARDSILSSAACHAAVRANHHLNIDERNALLRRMEITERSGSCNHGRPCWQQIERGYFDRIFRRGQ
jgi:DNA mismatch repair protein MutL